MSYAREKAKIEIKKLLGKTLKDVLEIDIPPKNLGADFAVPLFRLAKLHQTDPAKLAKITAEKLNLSRTVFSKVTASQGYLNFYLESDVYTQLVFKDFLNYRNQYGGSREGKGKTILIDESAPNIAKPFSVGHLRSTIIGDSLARIYRCLGYKVITDNHLGDWGTQFGKLICAYKKWGNKEIINKNPIGELLKLYIKFHQRAKSNPSIIDEARKWFRKLEKGDRETLKIWQWFTDISLGDFQKIYDLLGVKFDHVLGESFYSNQLAGVMKKVFDRGLAEWEIDPLSKKKVALVHLEKYGLKTPMLLLKSDEASLYATRDLACAVYRIKKFHPHKIIYVVGAEQKLYFQQLFKVLGLMGYNTALEHVWFGMVRLPEGRMSTREGRLIFLEDVLGEAIKKSQKLLGDRNISAEEKEQTSRIIGIGAVKYADLSHLRTGDIVFDWAKILNMNGDSAPYLQYVYVRIQSIFSRAKEKINLASFDPAQLDDRSEIDLVKKIAEFPEAIIKAAESFYPHLVANYLFDLAQLFNDFYQKVPVIKSKNKSLKHTRLYLCKTTAQVIKTGLELLGIECPEKM